MINSSFTQVCNPYSRLFGLNRTVFFAKSAAGAYFRINYRSALLVQIDCLYRTEFKTYKTLPLMCPNQALVSKNTGSTYFNLFLINFSYRACRANSAAILTENTTLFSGDNLRCCPVVKRFFYINMFQTFCRTGSDALTTPYT